MKSGKDYSEKYVFNTDEKDFFYLEMANKKFALKTNQYTYKRTIKKWFIILFGANMADSISKQFI